MDLTREQAQEVCPRDQRRVVGAGTFTAAHALMVDTTRGDLRAASLGGRRKPSPAGTREGPPRAVHRDPALRRQLGNALVHDHSPVSASCAERYALYDTSSTPTTLLAEHAPGGAVPHTGDPDARRFATEASVEPTQWTDEVLADHYWKTRITVRIAKVVGLAGQEGLSDLLREGPRPSQLGRPSDRLSRSRAVAITRMAQDTELRDLIKERDC